MGLKHAQSAFGKIRVLLIHENELARSAWKKVLGKSDQISVIDAVQNLKSYHLSDVTQPPEIIIANMSILVSGMLRVDQLKTVFGIRPKIIILTENKDDVKIAFKQGADGATAEPFDAQDLITQVRALSGEAENLCAEYRDEFSIIKAGRSQMGKFYDLVSNSLQLIFQPDLVNPESVMTSSANPLLSRLVFRNQARNHEFWIDTRQIHQSRYVTVDVYNNKLEPENIVTLGNYLSESHGLLGLIVGRRVLAHDLDEMSIALFENERKVVLILNETLIRDMLEYKAGGINPVCLLQDQYQKLIASARR